MSLQPKSGRAPRIVASVSVAQMSAVATFIDEALFASKRFTDCVHPSPSTWSEANVLERMPFQPYNSPAHIEIRRLLTNHTNQLSGGHFEGKNGASTFALVGAKGIGKTVTCRLFLQAAAMLWSNVLPVYVNYAGVSDPNHILASGGNLFKHVLRAIKAPQYVVDEVGPGKPATSVLLHFLVNHRLRVLLIVDELDEGYRMASDNEGLFKSTLGGLQVLGNSLSGRVAVVLCGSSATLPSLLCGHQEPEFPLSMTGVPNLNDHKYSTRRVPSATPVDLALVNVVLQEEMQSANTVALQREILYLAGANVREIKKLLPQRSNIAAHNYLPSTDMNTYESHRYARPLHMAMLDKLIAKNKTMLKKIYPKRAASEDIAYIREQAWHDVFAPLSSNDVDKLWQRLQDQKKIAQAENPCKTQTLHYLADRGYICVASSNSLYYYPGSIFALVTRMLEKRGLKHRQEHGRLSIALDVTRLRQCSFACFMF